MSAAATLDKPVGEFHRRLTFQNIPIAPLRLFMPMPMLLAIAWNAIATFHRQVNEIGGEDEFPKWPTWEDIGDRHLSDVVAFERVIDKILWLNTQLDDYHLHLAWCAEFKRNGGWKHGPSFSQSKREDPNLIADGKVNPDCIARIGLLRSIILGSSVPVTEDDFERAKKIGLNGRVERGNPVSDIQTAA